MRNDFIEAIKFMAETKWAYLAYALPLILFSLIFYLRNKKLLAANAMGFINWLRPGFETGGTSSAEKLTAFTAIVCTYIPGRLIFCFSTVDPIHYLWGSIIDATFICVLFKIISPQQLIDLRNGSSREKIEPTLDPKI